MATYILRDGQMVEKETGKPMLSEDERRAPVPIPRVFGDFEGYASPVTGEWIEGRRARAADLKKHGCVPAADLKPYNYQPRFRNRKFAEKRGLVHLLDE